MFARVVVVALCVALTCVHAQSYTSPSVAAGKVNTINIGLLAPLSVPVTTYVDSTQVVSPNPPSYSAAASALAKLLNASQDSAIYSEGMRDTRLMRFIHACLLRYSSSTAT